MSRSFIIHSRNIYLLSPTLVSAQKRTVQRRPLCFRLQSFYPIARNPFREKLHNLRDKGSWVGGRFLLRPIQKFMRFFFSPGLCILQYAAEKQDFFPIRHHTGEANFYSVHVGALNLCNKPHAEIMHFAQWLNDSWRESQKLWMIPHGEVRFCMGYT
jgi:hypothetical protein